MYDLEEQEKVDLLRDWWKRYQKYVWLGVALFALGFIGFNAYQYWSKTEGERAASAFAEFQEAVKGGDLVKVKAAAQVIETQSTSSPYAARAALANAQFLVGASQALEAQAQYRWVIEHASEPALQSLARIRLAGLLADDQKYSEALSMLDTGIEPAFLGMAKDRAGDIYLAQGKKMEARTAYEEALKAMDTKHPLSQVVSIKLDALGGASTPKEEK